MVIIMTKFKTLSDRELLRNYWEYCRESDEEIDFKSGETSFHPLNESDSFVKECNYDSHPSLNYTQK